MNDFWNFLNAIPPHQLGRSEQINSHFAGIASAFDKLPSPNDLTSGAGDFATTTGTGAAYLTERAARITSLVAGARLRAKLHATSLAAPTINVDGLGAAQIRDWLGAPLLAGAMPAGTIATLDFDGAVWRMAKIESVASDLAGFGIGTLTPPLLADFHSTSIGAGRYRWEAGVTLNSPMGLGGGTADLAWRLPGVGTWEAREAAGGAGFSDPITFRKATSGTPGDWSPWRRDEQSESNANGWYCRLGGGLQVCATKNRTLTYQTASSLWTTWVFPAPFIDEPWFVSGVAPEAAIGSYSGVSIGSISALVVNPKLSPGVSATIGLRLAPGETISPGASVNPVSAFAIGRWY